MKMFFELLVAFFFCSVLTNGQNADDCVNKYMVYNSFDHINQMNVSCYSNSSCSLLYFPPGETKKSVDLGTVPAGGARLIKADVTKYGRLFSNGQIGVYTWNTMDPQKEEIVVLPRGSDAGTNFAALISYIGEASGFYVLCSFASFKQPAKVTYRLGNANPSSFSLCPYCTSTITFSFPATANQTFRVTSNTSIIVSCYDKTNKFFHIWQPTSNAPVFTFAKDHYATILLSDCQTNEPISDFSRVKIDYVRQIDDSCTVYSTISPNDSVLGKSCGLLVTPNDTNTCISITKQHVTGALADTGYPESKRVLQVNQIPIYSYTVDSLSYDELKSCKFSSNSIPVAPTTQYFLAGSIHRGIFLNIIGGKEKLELGRISCDEPAFIYRSDESYYSLQSYGKQSEDAWKSYFDTLTCSSSGTLLGIFFSGSTWIALVFIWFS